MKTDNAVRILLFAHEGRRAELAKLLEDSTFEVEALAELDTALDALSSGRGDVCLIDCEAPGAADLAQAATGARRRVPVVSVGDHESIPAELRDVATVALDPAETTATLLARTVEYAIEHQQVNELHQRLAVADRMASIGRLAAGVAHDINNPAAFVLMNLEVMREHVTDIRSALDTATRELPSEPRQQLKNILDRFEVERGLEELHEMVEENQGGMSRIRSIVRDLSSFSRIEEDDVALVDLGGLVESTCNLVAHQLKSRARLVKQLEKVPEVMGHAHKLSQVLVNLLVNAAQSIEPGKPDDNEVRVEAYTGDAGEAVIAVADTGAGVPQEIRDRIFEPFFTTKPREVGTGLGLSLAAEIARKHGGAIHLRDEPGGGSRFELHLPHETRPAVTDGPVANRARTTDGTRGRILVVDDDEQVLKAYRRVLHRIHDVTTVASGEEALDVLEKDGDFDLIVCDLVMPGLDGAQLFELIRERALFPPEQVVFCSGATLADSTRAVIERSDNLLLEKPVTPRYLLEVVERYVRAARP